MLASARLGFRLSTAGGWRRPASMTFASALGAFLLAIAWELPGTILTTEVDGDQEHVVTVATMVAVIGVPVVLLLLAVNRLSAHLRDQRLARLRILGLASWRVRVVAAVENATFSALGALVGVAIFAGIAPRAGRWLMTQGGLLHTTFPATLADLALVVAAVVGLAAVVAMAPHRTITGNGLTTRQEGRRPAPSPWRMAPLALGLALTAYTIARPVPADTSPPADVTDAFLGGTILTAVGIVVSLVPVMSWISNGLAQLPLPVPLLLAARRQQAEPTSVVRLLTGLVLAVFLTAFAMGPIAVLEATPQFAAVSRIAQHGPRETLTASNRPIPATDIAQLEQAPGVLAVFQRIDDELMCDGGDGDWVCGQAIAVECAAATRILGPGTCSTEHPTLVRLQKWAPEVGALHTTRDGQRVEIPATQVSVTIDPAVTWLLGNAILVLTPNQAETLGLNHDRSFRIWSDTSAAGTTSVASWLSDHRLHASDTWRSTLAELNRNRFIVRSIGTIIIGLGLLIVLIATADRVIERRRAVANLVAIGVPRTIMVRAQLMQALIGLIPATALGVGCGIACATAYLSLGNTLGGSPPWSSWTGVALVALCGAAVVSLASVAGVGGRITPEALRRE